MWRTFKSSVNHHQLRPCLFGPGGRFLSSHEHSWGLVYLGQKRRRTAGLRFRSRKSLGALQITCSGGRQQLGMCRYWRGPCGFSMDGSWMMYLCVYIFMNIQYTTMSLYYVYSLYIIYVIAIVLPQWMSAPWCPVCIYIYIYTQYV